MSSIDRRAEFWDPENPGYLFHAEAKRLLELELDTTRLTTIQSLCIIGLTYSQNALDKIGWPRWDRAFAMAEELQIFGDLETDQSLTHDVRLARGFTAWCLFNLGSYVAVGFSQQYEAEANAWAVSLVFICKRTLSGRIHQRHRYLILEHSVKSGCRIPKSE